MLATSTHCLSGVAFLPVPHGLGAIFHSGVGVLACKCTGLEAYSTALAHAITETPRAVILLPVWRGCVKSVRCRVMPIQGKLHQVGAYWWDEGYKQECTPKRELTRKDGGASS